MNVFSKQIYTMSCPHIPIFKVSNCDFSHTEQLPYPFTSQLQLRLHLTSSQQLRVQLQMMGFSQAQLHCKCNCNWWVLGRHNCKYNYIWWVLARHKNKYHCNCCTFFHNCKRKWWCEVGHDCNYNCKWWFKAATTAIAITAAHTCLTTAYNCNYIHFKQLAPPWTYYMPNTLQNRKTLEHSHISGHLHFTTLSLIVDRLPFTVATAWDCCSICSILMTSSVTMNSLNVMGFILTVFCWWSGSLPNPCISSSLSLKKVIHEICSLYKH